AMNPRSATTQRQLALSLFAAGEPHDAVLQALGQSWELRAESDRKAVELSDRAALAALEGDLAGATSLVADWLAAVAARPDQSAHATPAFELADLHTEMGEPAKAAAAAEDFQRHMGAWTDPPEGDWTLTALGYQLRAGKVTRAGFAEARAAWLERVRAKWRAAGKRLDVDADWSLWSGAYGWLVDGEADAREALAALPRATSAAVSTGRWTSVDLFAGKSYALAGDFAAALPHLRRAARSCATLAEPLTATRAQLWLGVALEGSGDREGARAAYEAVLRRWGAAKPRSLTAEQAQARLASLGAR
ncbi:MAG: hypothetical protein IT373_13640, partial [Polyangiaceae bacterium]|nr:hypothetical protein [Polyangiaceae bacterium]